MSSVQLWLNLMDITNTVVEIIAQWLKFPISGKSRAQGWFIQAMVRECDPSTLYLDSVWFAFNHLESEVFGKLCGETPSSASYAKLSVALQNCALADPGSETKLVVKKIDALVTNYRTSRVAPGPPVPAVASVPTAARRKTAAPVRSAIAAGPHLLLTLADDATQQQNMAKFLAYLVELEPLIDGYGGSWGRLTQISSIQDTMFGPEIPPNLLKSLQKIKANGRWIVLQSLDLIQKRWVKYDDPPEHSIRHSSPKWLTGLRNINMPGECCGIPSLSVGFILFGRCLASSDVAQTPLLWSDGTFKAYSQFNNQSNPPERSPLGPLRGASPRHGGPPRGAWKIIIIRVSVTTLASLGEAFGSLFLYCPTPQSLKRDSTTKNLRLGSFIHWVYPRPEPLANTNRSSWPTDETVTGLEPPEACGPGMGQKENAWLGERKPAVDSRAEYFANRASAGFCSRPQFIERFRKLIGNRQDRQLQLFAELRAGTVFSIFDNFNEECRHKLKFDQIALKLGTLESYSKSAVNAIPVFLMLSKNEISTAKSLSSASHL
ncbi:hypothetical protein DFH08DRAFT_1011335 [Mycena albidolilacea]|uniref:Uncharacterized protein n=1 Tax=Mycena albidolilacea TaxID=1033008 RepID=A0AAD6ZW88_9AGAR|nr:hypothetical protein DFH08DRAFT_1011331 [Mycena albidolilacea]KAJ7342870.1 hypothetical protein DFH08DRAFT_1011335 [Mycena albidolilacea]